MPINSHNVESGDFYETIDANQCVNEHRGVGTGGGGGGGGGERGGLGPPNLIGGGADVYFGPPNVTPLV